MKLYRTVGMVTVAAPMPGLTLGDIKTEVTADGQLRLFGQVAPDPCSGALDDRPDKHVILEEWTVGPYQRELQLPTPVDASAATVTYGNGVLVVALPVAERTCPATLRATAP